MSRKKNIILVIIIGLLVSINGTMYGEQNQKNDEDSGIFSRTTVRKFASKEISKDIIDSLLKAALGSPTGGNQRAWEFIVVTDKDKLQLMKGGNPYSQPLDTATLVIVIAANRNNARYKELLEFDSGIAAQSIMVRAGELGLGTVAMSITPQPERVESVSEALGLPDGVVPHIMIAVGKPATDTDVSSSVIYENDSKIHYNKF